MPSGFNYNGEDFDRVFMTDYEIVDRFVGATLWAWGSAGSGGLGDNSITEKSSPVTTSGGGTNWQQVAGSIASGGTTMGCAIKTDGTLWTWGDAAFGRSGNSSTIDRSSPGTTSGGGNNWKQTACGYLHTAAVKTDGTLWTWGYNGFGNLGDGTTTNRSSPGTTAGGGANWKQVALSGSAATFSAAVKTDGTLWTWGRNADGQLGTNLNPDRSSPGTTSGGGTNWNFIACGLDMMAGIKTDGTLWTWGRGQNGQLGTGSTANRSSPGTTAGGGTNWKQVACAYFYNAAVKTDGTLWTWGYNQRGNLGTGNTTSRSSPGTTAGGGTNWKRVSCGSTTTAAVKTDGTLWTWGSNNLGALGDGTTTSRSSPGTTLGSGTIWKEIHVAGHVPGSAIQATMFAILLT
jgi:alpha-tubulin suppressor-like RCC1 family protein